jgi:hypothetical protein
VLDANILMWAVLGRRVRELLERYEDSAAFYSPDVCFDDAHHYVAQVLEKRGLNPESGLSVLRQVSRLVESVDSSLYGDYERLHVRGSRFATRTTGRWSLSHCCLICPFGLRIEICLAAALRRGRRTGSRYT